MRLGPELLLLPYSSRWRGKPLPFKLTVSGVLLVLSIVPAPWPVAIGAGGVASALAIRSAGVRPLFWVQLLSAPLLFAVLSAGIAAWGGAESGESIARTLGASAATLLLGTTTPIQDLVAWLQRRRGFQVVAELMLLAYRALTAVVAAGLAMTAALRARRLGQRWQTAPRLYGAFSGALAIRSLERARRAESGMAARRLSGSLRLLPSERQT
jgi:cobalt/nickel transport system permease protein